MIGEVVLYYCMTIKIISISTKQGGCIYLVCNWFHLKSLHFIYCVLQLATATDFDLAFNKGQYGASKWVQDEMASTSLHPSLLASPALMLTGGGIGHYSPLVSDSAQLGTSTIGDIIKSYGVNCE